jgi:hypothetical protein
VTKKQLKALEALPDVIDALTSLAQDAEKLRLAMAKASGLGVLPAVGVVAHVQSAGTPGLGATKAENRAVTAPAPLMIPTPERAEYEAQRASPAPYDPAAEEEPAYMKRQKAALAAMRNDPRREAALKQFANDGEDLDG